MLLMVWYHYTWKLSSYMENEHFLAPGLRFYIWTVTSCNFKTNAPLKYSIKYSRNEYCTYIKLTQYSVYYVYICFLFVCLFVGDFLREPHVYEDLLDFKALKSFIESQLEDYNLTPGVIPMSLVLFRDAIEHGQLQCIS